VVVVSAKTRQSTLGGGTIRERAPSDPVAAALDHLPEDTPMPPEVPWARLAEERDTAQVLAWIDRAAAEGVI
jgi:hypothetical protein